MVHNCRECSGLGFCCLLVVSKCHAWWEKVYLGAWELVTSNFLWSSALVSVPAFLPHPQLFPSSTHLLFLSSQGACCPQVMFYNCSLLPHFFLICFLMPQSLCWPLLASVTSELTAGGMLSPIPSYGCHSPSHHCNEPSPGRDFLILNVARVSRQNTFLSGVKKLFSRPFL